MVLRNDMGLCTYEGSERSVALKQMFLGYHPIWRDSNSEGSTREPRRPQCGKSIQNRSQRVTFRPYAA